MKISAVIDGIKLEDEELRAVLKEAKAAVRRERGIMAPLILYGIPILTGFVGVYGSRFITPFVSLNRIIQSLAIAGMTVILVYLFLLFQRHMYDDLMLRHIRSAMQHRGHDLCAECGYWLTGHDEKQATCPECGTSIPLIPSVPESSEAER